MDAWWHREVVEPGKLPLVVCLAAFVVAFLAVRTITRLIRAGRGPFRNVTPGGIHVHHAVPGVVLATVGGFGSVAAGGQGWAKAIWALVFGVGIALVLDEFALLLRMSDVYWSEQGRVSVEIVSLTAAVVGMLVLGAVPFGVDDVEGGEAWGRVATAVVVALNFLFVVAACLKGKYGLGVVGVVVPPLAWIGAVRLAHPRSVWARRWYGEGSRRRRRAEARAAIGDRRWGPWRRRLLMWVAGTPSH